MAKVLVVYYSKTGNLKKMTDFVKEGLKEGKVDVICKSVKGVQLKN